MHDVYGAVFSLYVYEKADNFVITEVPDKFRNEFIEKINIELPESDLNHNILVFKKVKNTPDKYPRKAGKPAKSPIK